MYTDSQWINICGQKEADGVDDDRKKARNKTATKITRRLNELPEEVQATLKDLRTKADAVEKKLKSAQAEYNKAERDKMAANREFKHAKRNRELVVSAMYQVVKNRAFAKADKFDALTKLQMELKEIRRMQYYYRNCHTSTSSARKPANAIPVDAQNGLYLLDENSYQDCIKAIGQSNVRVGITTNDPGHVYMMTFKGFGGNEAIRKTQEFGLQLSNRFSVLNDSVSGPSDASGTDDTENLADNIDDATSAGESDKSDIEDPMDADDDNADIPPKPPDKPEALQRKATSIRGAHLKNFCGHYRHRQRRKKAAQREIKAPFSVVIGEKKFTIQTVKDAQQFLKKIEPNIALSTAELRELAQLRGLVQDIMIDFNNSNARNREKRTQKLRLVEGWARLAAKMRHEAKEAAIRDKPCPDAQTVDPTTGECSKCCKVHVQDHYGGNLSHAKECPHIANKLMTTRLYIVDGLAGRCFNSPFGGADRWNGNKLVNSASKHTVTIMAPEDGSSSHCRICSYPLECAKRTIIDKNGIVKVTEAHGTLECRNPHCAEGLKKRDDESSKFTCCYLGVMMADTNDSRTDSPACRINRRIKR